MFRVTTIVLLAVVTLSTSTQPDMDSRWKEFKSKFGKRYRVKEEISRRVAWERNTEIIKEHNREADNGVYSFRLGENEYSDVDHKQFVSIMNRFKMSKKQQQVGAALKLTAPTDLPSTVDWRKEGLVSAVGNQGQCGACWAFSAAGSLEGQHKKKTGQLVQLSVQNLVDCSGEQGNMGCWGGTMDNAFRYVIQNKGVAKEAAYPYTGQAFETCRYDPATVGATCTGYKDIPQGDEQSLMQAVATVGPVSVAIDASIAAFQQYKDGVFDDPSCSSTQLDHAVLVVGYGTQDGKDYWLVKNSWGTTWGQDGYGMMSRNKNNQCGIVTQASYPVV